MRQYYNKIKMLPVMFFGNFCVLLKIVCLLSKTPFPPSSTGFELQSGVVSVRTTA